VVLPAGRQLSQVKFPQATYECFSGVLTRSEVRRFFRLRYRRDPLEIQDIGAHWLAGPIPPEHERGA